MDEVIPGVHCLESRPGRRWEGSSSVLLFGKLHSDLLAWHQLKITRPSHDLTPPFSPRCLSSITPSPVPFHYILKERSSLAWGLNEYKSIIFYLCQTSLISFPTSHDPHLLSRKNNERNFKIQKQNKFLDNFPITAQLSTRTAGVFPILDLYYHLQEACSKAWILSTPVKSVVLSGSPGWSCNSYERRGWHSDPIYRGGNWGSERSAGLRLHSSMDLRHLVSAFLGIGQLLPFQ